MAMKKAYVTPEIKEIKIMANQAIAACSVSFAGWQNAWNRSSTGYGSEAEARAAHDQAPLFPIYYVEGNTSNGGVSSMYWEDQNSNGVWDGQGVDNLQNGVNQWWELDTTGMAAGSVGAVTAS